ncbi:EAL domain-containing protein [Rossellomorea vietnamensis]|uniref:EAL domain-containing protein n=1 Tax=Rossellomorea vietnamensis TaxID=218284 RepID=UPI001653D6F3|nr:EAL domain-containing protein [Rossellomorea vietnamensis]
MSSSQISIKNNNQSVHKNSKITELVYFKLLFEHSPDIILHFDCNGNLLNINKATTCLTGHHFPDQNPSLTDFTPDELKGRVRSHFQAALNGNIENFSSQAYHKDGHLLNLDITYIPIKENTETAGVYAIIHEVSDKIALQSALETKDEEMEQVSQALEAAIWSYDNLTKSVTFCTQGINFIAEMEAEEFIKRKTKWRELVYLDDLKKFDEDRNPLKYGETICHRYRIITPSGKIKWLNDKIIPIKDDNDRIIRYHGIITDITKDKELGDRVEHLLHHDSLTALPNRKTLETEMTSLIKQNAEFAMIYVDLNRFKYMNETLGPVIGDEILEEAARRLKRFQERGIFVSRFSNDDFVLLLKEFGTLTNVSSLCKEIIDCLKDPYEIKEFELLLTISVGVSLYPSDSNGITELFQNSIAAMNRAKENGRNSFHIFSPENSIDAYKRFVLEKDFRLALMREELQLFFQPQVDSRQNQIVGAEALLRWEHSEWGIVSPNEFIPYAEENGFIIPVGEWVLEKACQTLEEWRKRGIPLVPISINLSPQHFLVKDLKTSLLSVLEKYQIPPRLIRLEITEAVFLQQAQIVKQTIEELRESGMKILIDDFGTGYTSFAYLKDLTVDGIKIDRSYTKSLAHDPKSRAIIKNLANLSADLNMSATIEGIETEKQLKFLHEIHCHLIQGYIYSKPVSETEFESMLKGSTIKPISTSTKNLKQTPCGHFRFQPPVPLQGYVTISSMNKKTVTTGKTRVPITDIGPGGLAFISHIQFPENKDILLHFSMKILGEEVVLTGKIVWKEEFDDEFCRYGVEFQVSEIDRESLSETLTSLSMAFKRDGTPLNTELIEKDLFSFLKDGKH